MKYDSKKRKLLKGEFQRENGMYVFRIVVGGKRRSLYSMSLPELRKKERELMNSVERGIDIDLKNTTLNDLAEEYIRDKKKTVQITTYQTMEFMYRRYIKDTLGKQVLGKIKRSTVKQHYLNLISGDHKISISTLARLDCIVKPLFERAVNDDIIFKNPARGVMGEIKAECREVPQKKCALTEEQQDTFLEYLFNGKKHDGIKNLIVFLLGTGCRVGEAIGLTWDDIDFDKNIISINHAAAYVKLDGHYRHIIKRTKSVAGDRDIPMLSEVKKALLDQKWRQEVLDVRQPVVDGYTGFVFLSERDRVYTRENISAQVKQIIRDYNENTDGYKLPEFSTHQLRHTFATRLCRNTSDLKSIQKILGHKDISTTMNIYADATDDGVAESMQALEGVMFRKNNCHK